jgi:tetratricopeptide (TPR) repeat protein
MPVTLNGIGTRYYGRHNLTSHPGVCAHCGHNIPLSSYDTRLWFVILFIPVVPLGRKRILDQCPRCTRHRVLPLAEWDRVKGENIAEQTALMKARPDDPVVAMKLHAALEAFGQTAEASQLADLLKERFRDSAPVQSYLGSSLVRQGRSREASACFQRALELDPNQLEAKIQIGLERAGQGNLEEARGLLQFLEAPDNRDGMGALYSLGLAYQRANRHREALELFALVGERLPALAQDKGFRKAVKQSEAALGQKESHLPPRRRNWKPVLLIGGTSAVVLAGLLISNYYMARHRKVYIVSGLSQPVTVEVPGVAAVTVMARVPVRMEVPEGRHEAVVTGATNQTVPFTVEPGFSDRWSDQKVHVINVAGSALLLAEETFYTPKTGVSTPPGRGDFQLHFGEPFLVVPAIDYVFAAFPSSINVESSASYVRKRRLDLVRTPFPDVFYSMVNLQRYTEAMRLAEWDLTFHPEESDLLPNYLGTARLAGREDQARAFLAQGTRRRPIDIQWHRVYQESRRTDTPALVAEYDGLVKSEPENSALLYLRGRLSPSCRESASFYERAIRAGLSNAFAHYALGLVRASQGRWSEARLALARACEIRPADEQFQTAWFESRLALKDYAALERDLGQRLGKQPLNFYDNIRLADIYAAEGKNRELSDLIKNLGAKIRARFPDSALELLAPLNARADYSMGSFEPIVSTAARMGSAFPHSMHFEALVELGKLDDAVKLYPLDGEQAGDAFHYLAASLAFQRAGRPEPARAWQERALKLFNEGSAEHRLAGRMLGASKPPSKEALEDLALLPSSKALFCAALGLKFPGQKTAFFARARVLNVTRNYPFHLVNRITEGAEP